MATDVEVPKKKIYSAVVRRHVELMGEINIKLRIMKLFFQDEGMNELAEYLNDEIVRLNKIFGLAVKTLRESYELPEE